MQNQFIIETFETKLGNMTLKVNDYFLHSKYNPIIEADRFAENHYEPHHIHILFGYGLGYIVDSLKEKFKYNELLIIIDPLFDDSLLEVQAEHSEKGLDKFLYNSKYINKLDNIIDNIKSVDFQNTFKIICSPNYEKLFPEFYLQILKKVKDIQKSNMVNEVTIFSYSEIWQKNFSENLISLFEDRNLVKLEQAYSCPVIIASGGPSLTKQLPLLKKIQDNVIIIAAGSTINSVLHYGIEPDYVASIDGAEESYDQFRELELNGSKLFYSVFNHPGIRKKFGNRGYAFTANSDKAIHRYLTEKIGLNLPTIVGGGSIAQYAYSLAQYISSGPIALIGQDLAYTNNQTHAANNKQAERIEESWKKSDNMFTVDGFDGEAVWTSSVFNSMRITFEQMIENYPPKNIVFNCTEGGVRLKGFEQKSFKDFCEEYVQEELPKKVKRIEDHAYKVSQDEWEKLKELLEAELEDYVQIIKYLSKGLTALENNGSNTVFNNKTLKKLNKVDKEIANRFSKVQMDFIVTPITLEVLKGFLEKENETATEKYTRVFNQTKTLYSKLLEATNKSKIYTENVVKRIGNEKLIK
ncbi:motility associated factor glycosyltransferase family protein [Lysinibacillus parviboronicapiens]|uniref:motility associated factor glycosyltransferase family protein n=1 Tax=Lysinibacillus parviboronicapiens TaxID=436516 RepID=UPI000D370F7C|nr:6-hydroxymethylpterin diphosphokinase MptE-like protein [Lysinibacillus parviboronicapiens]